MSIIFVCISVFIWVTVAVPIYCNTLGHIWLQFNFKFDTELEVEQTQDTDEVATLEMNDFVIMPDNKV